MIDPFKAYVLTRDEETRVQSGGWITATEDDLMAGDVTVRVHATTMNYKDALAITGKSPIARVYPLVPGIDFAGEVVASDSADYAVGDQVILNGWGVGEKHWGGYAQYARVKSDWLLPLPDGLSGADCMAVGTAGYTAALCVMRILDLGVTPADGPVLVTGASGGVGSFSVALLSALGFEVHAATGRTEEEAYLKRLGASEIVDRGVLSGKFRPLESETYAAAVDSVGSQTLAGVLARIKYNGVVAACGLAQGFDLPATVMPFILRGVTLAGVESVMAPKARRLAAWDLLAKHLDRDLLAEITQEGAFEDLETLAPQLIDGKIRGRLLIRVP